MADAEITRRVMAVISKHMFKQRTLALDDTLEALEIDSLALAEILFDLEEEFGILIEFNANRAEEQRDRFRTVREAVAKVEELIAEQSAEGSPQAASPVG